MAERVEGEAYAAWRLFVEGLAERAPLVLALEDLHWADDGLLDFVDDLVDRASRRAAPRGLHRAPRAARAEARMGWRQAQRGVRPAPPLSAEETTLLVERLLQGEALPPGAEEAARHPPKAIPSTPRSTPAWWPSGNRVPSCPRRRPCTG